MPYEIRRRGGRYCVYKEGTNQRFGCHSSRREAGQQITAIERSEGKKEVDLTPTRAMQRNACRALERRREVPASRRGMTDTGLARARDICNRRQLSPETVREMNAWFARHQETSRSSPNYTDRNAAWQSWNGWGGDAGKTWASRKVEQLSNDKAIESGREGDFVSWAGGGDEPTRGEIIEIVRDGSIQVPDSDFTLAATDDDPAALMQVWRQNADGEWQESNDYVARRFSRLERIESLKMYEDDEDKDMMDYGGGKLPQDYVGFQRVQTEAPCGACFFYHGEGNCKIVEPRPAMITALSGCDRYESAAAVVENVVMEIDGAAALKKPSIVKKGVNLIRGKQAPTGIGTGFKAFADEGVWLTHYTNAFKDYDGEIFSRQAHKDYLTRVTQWGTVDYPVLWHLHIPGTEHGKAWGLGMVDKVVLAFGNFGDDEFSEQMKAWYDENDHIGFEVSHGFMFPQWALKNSVYHSYNTFEISTLLPGEAANPYVSFESIRKMHMNEDALKKKLDRFANRPKLKEAFEAAIDSARDASKELTEAGVQYKAFDTAEDVPPGDDHLADQDVLYDMIAAQTEMNEQMKALVGVLNHEKATNDDLRKELSAIKAQLDNRPKSVQNGGGVKASGEEVKAAKETVEAQQPVEYDPMFPGMKVPVNKPGGQT